MRETRHTANNRTKASTSRRDAKLIVMHFDMSLQKAQNMSAGEKTASNRPLEITGTWLMSSRLIN